MTDYFKYHGLGNDYLVLEPARFRGPPGPEAVRQICTRHRGIGADGILWGPLAGLPEVEGRGLDEAGAPAVRIFNPDGSEAEKSGNGLRIFARHLWAQGLVTARTFAMVTSAGAVEARVLDDAGTSIAIRMGTVRFEAVAIPIALPQAGNGEALGVPLALPDGRRFTINGAGIGNPHCVIFAEDAGEALARSAGPLIETHPAFPNRTNVQFARVLDAHRLRIWIWERGAGYTEASGSSSCAAAAVACRLGHCTPPVTVETDGGPLTVELDASFEATLTGPVAAVGTGKFAEEFLTALGMTRA